MTIRRKLNDRQLCRTLREHTMDVLEDFILPGAYDGLTYIHYAVLTPGGVVCVLRKHCAGLVSGDVRTPQWIDERGTRRQQFLNPVIQNEGHVKALTRVVRDVPVHNLVVFTGPVRFDSVLPENVVHMSKLAEHIDSEFQCKPAYPGLVDAWRRLQSAALTDPATRKDLDAQLSFG